MSKINSFEDLDIWKNAFNLASDVYDITSIGNLKRDYGLIDQLQRATVSISNNIAEGFEYDNNKDFIKYLRYAKGSAGEARSMIHFLLKRKHITEAEHKEKCDRYIQLSKQIGSFIKYLRNFEEGKKSKFKKSD